MSEDITGEISHKAGCYEIRFQRHIEHHQSAVWQMLTDSDKLPLWLAPGHLALVNGGIARLNFHESGMTIDSVIVDVEPPRMIEYSWSRSGEATRPLRWEVKEETSGAGLTLCLRIPESEDAAKAAAGWEAHLDMLAAALEGVPIGFPFSRFKAAREAYRALLSKQMSHQAPSRSNDRRAGASDD